MTPHDPITPTPADLYRRLFEHASVAQLAADADFRIVCLNRPACEILGASDADLRGRALTEIAPESRRGLFDRILRRARDRGEGAQFEFALPTPEGTQRHLLVILSALPLDGGQTGVAAYLIDETQQHRIADRLARAQKSASLGTLAAGVAHHFNNIFGGVATFVDFALTSGDATAMRRALQMTAEATTRAARITQSLLSFAAQDGRGGDYADLTEILLTFLHLHEQPLSDKGILLDLDLRPTPVVPVDAHRMRQVLANLLSNAEDAMPDGGTLSVFLAPDEQGVRLTVGDTGAGIAPRNLPLIFEPFFTTKGLHAGGDRANVGLGLSVVQGLVGEMGGTIDVESEPGRGTRFVITLPVREDE